MKNLKKNFLRDERDKIRNLGADGNELEVKWRELRNLVAMGGPYD